MLNYRKTDPSFPHQATVDQWFDETQFESYRSLGYHIGTTAVEKFASASAINTVEPIRHDIAKLCTAIEHEWDSASASAALVGKATD